MNRIVYSCLVITPLVFLFPTTALAQQWSAEEQVIIDHAKRCWELWRLENVADWKAECPADTNIRFWWTAQSVPLHGTNEWEAWAQVFHPKVNEIFQAHRPVAVQFYGDIALYYYWGTWSWEDANGEVQTGEQHRLDIFQRRENQWWWVGGTGTPIERGSLF